MKKGSGTILYLKILLIAASLLLCFQAQSYAANVTLEWDANTQPDLDHYVLFWGTSSGNYGDDSGNIDKSQTTYTVAGLSEGTAYYFAVKAYDDQGRESEYSNEVETSGTEIILDGGSIAGDDGGCFIATASFGSNMDRHVEILCAFRDNRW